MVVVTSLDTAHPWSWRKLSWSDVDGAMVAITMETDDGKPEIFIGSGPWAGRQERSLTFLPKTVWSLLRSKDNPKGASVLLCRAAPGGPASLSTEERHRLERIVRGEELADPEDHDELFLRAHGHIATFERAESPAAVVMRYLEGGLAVFPVTRDKTPFKGSHGHLDASKDEAQVAAHWAAWPRDNIGVATGSASNLIVIDIDPRHGGTLESAADLFGRAVLQTRRVTTPGDGWHCWFWPKDGDIPPSVGLNDMVPGVEVKSTGRYVVAPPSVARHGCYRWHDPDVPLLWWPDGASDVARDLATAKAPRAALNLPTDGFWVDIALLVNAVRTAPDGTRNDRLFAAALVVAETRVRSARASDARQVADAAQSAGLSPVEVRKTIRSAFKCILGDAGAEEVDW